MTDTQHVPEPKEIAEVLRSSQERQKERWEKLAPFSHAPGWMTYQTDVYRQLADNRLSVDYADGRFKLFFFGAAERVSFDSAEDAMKYVAEIEQQLADG